MEIRETKIIDEFDNLQKSKKEIEEKIENIRKEIIEFTVKNNKSFLIGTYKTCTVKEFQKIVYPENKEMLLKLIREKGLYERFSSINYFKLNPAILRNEIDKDILNLVKKEKDFRISLISK